MSMKEGRWAVIHPLNHVIRIHINEDFSYIETRINLRTEIENLENLHLTNFSSCGDGQNIYVFGGFTFPKYDPAKENLY